MQDKSIVQYEYISPDEGESFRLIHTQTVQDYYFWHYHPEIELVFVKNGSGRQYVGNHRSYYDNGTLVLIGSNVPHLNFSFGRKGNIDEVVVQMPVKFVDSFCKNWPEAKNIEKLIERSKRGIVFGKNLQAKCELQIRNLENKKGLERVWTLFQILENMATTTDFEYLNPINSTFRLGQKDQFRLNKVIEYIETNFAAEPNYEFAADLCGLSISSFSRFFKKYTGVTYTDFLNETRINQARKLLADGKNVSETAFEVGFNHLGHFNEIFNKYVGQNPKDFRKLFLVNE